MKIVTLLLMILVNASMCEDYKITLFFSRGGWEPNKIKHPPLVMFNGTKAETEFQECNADLSVLGPNISCTIKVDQEIGDFKCLNIRKNAADDDERTGEELYSRDEFIPITLLKVELPNNATKYFAAPGPQWSSGIGVYNKGRNFCNFTDVLPSWNKWLPGPRRGSTVLDHEGDIWYWIYAYFTVPPVFLILIITFCGIACCRGKVCPCCNRTKTPDMQNIVTVQP